LVDVEPIEEERGSFVRLNQTCKYCITLALHVHHTMS
jgi:hypothetical protein